MGDYYKAVEAAYRSTKKKVGKEYFVIDCDRHIIEPPAALGRVEGAARAKSAAEVAAATEVVFACLPGPAEVESVALGARGIAEGAYDGLVFVDLATNFPAAVKRVAEGLAAKGVAMLEAPVLPVAAREAT